MNNSEEKVRHLQFRFRILYVVVAVWFLLYVMRLWQLQILNGAEFKEFSERNLLKETRIAAPRGIVYDQHNQVLVENLPGFEVTISPQYTENLKKLADAMSPIVDIPADNITKKVKKSRRRNGPFYPVSIKENLSRDEVFRLKQLRLDHSGLDIQEVIIRSYPLKENGAHLFGYVGEISKKEIPKRNAQGSHIYRQGDIIGINGLERSFEKYVRGVAGISFKQVDARGRETSSQSVTIFGQRVKDEAAIPGNNLVLTLDRDIQKAAYKSFEDLERVGAIVAMKPTGEILAWVSRPAFDPNVFSRRISPELWKSLLNDPDKPLVNKVVQDHKSPGSTFKPFVALAALQEKLVKPQVKVSTPGFLRLGRRIYHDNKRGGHGDINMFQALERSSNVYFFRLGMDLGVDKMFDYTRLFGLGSKTGIEIQNEIRGLLPNSEWKLKERGEPWQPGENYHMAIGQGYILTTPIQMALAYAAIANEGKLYKPFIVKKVISHEDEVLFEQAPTLVHDLNEPDDNGTSLSPDTFKHVKKGLWMVGNGERGTARWYKVPGVEISGKSGTTQVVALSAEKLFKKCEDMPHERRHHGWFIGYAPAENPEIVVSVLAEHSCGGSKGAGPVVRDVIRSYYEKYHPEVIEKGVEEQKQRWRALAKKRKREREEQQRLAEEAEAQETQSVIQEATP